MSEQIRENPGAGTRPRVVLDTDAFNEVDDQFALAYLLHASDRVEAEAIYAAPFFNSRSDSPGDGMEKSFQEIGRILTLSGQPEVPAFRGSNRFLDVTAPKPGNRSPDPVQSEAVADLITRSMTATHSDRLIVIAIGALTNVASALLTEPEMVERSTVVWLGGHYPYWPHQKEFNLTGDVAAARVVFNSGVPLYVVPCIGVASHLLATSGELKTRLPGNSLSQFLLKRFDEYGSRRGAKGTSEEGVRDQAWSKVIWDIAAVAWMVLPGAVKSFPLATPRVAEDGSYVHDPRRNHCRFAYELDRDAIFSDMYRRLRA